MITPPDQVRVLIVDDEPALTDIASIFLSRNGFSVGTAHSASEALEKIRPGEYDVIVSDYEMPCMNGIGLLKEIRTDYPRLPFILFTGRGREAIAIEALNNGADFYLQKGGNPSTTFGELSHMITRAYEQRRASEEIRENNEILSAILAASPYGVALVKDRSIRWLNDALGTIFGYSVEEMQGMPVRILYESDDAYNDAGNRIMQDLECEGRSVLRTRLKRKDERIIDCEIHMAPLKLANPQFGRMITINDITKTVAISREMEQLSSLPHLELNPVVEVNRDGRITYFNEAAIETAIKIGDGTKIQDFLPPDMREILADTNLQEEIRTLYRSVVMGKSVFMEHITISSRFGIARISAVPVSDAKERDEIAAAARMTN